jgi:putative transposase
MDDWVQVRSQIGTFEINFGWFAFHCYDLLKQTSAWCHGRSHGERRRSAGPAGNLIDRGLDPKVRRLFIVDGTKAQRKAILRTFGKHTPVQRRQIHKGRNIMERLPKHLHASMRRTLRQALACINIIENMMGTILHVCRNVKHWRNAAMALRWTGAAMREATKGFRRLKAHKQLPVLRAALLAIQGQNGADQGVAPEAAAA